MIMLLTFSVAHAQWVIDEGFEGTWPPADWTIMSSSNPSNAIVQSSDQAYSGTYSARFSSYFSGAPYDEYLITPEVLSIDGDQASFWYRGYSYGTESFCVGWSSTGTDVNTDFTWGPDISDASTTWQQYVKTDLPAGTKYVAIHYYSDYMYYLYVDEFKVGSVPPTQSEQFGWEDGFSTVLGYYGSASFENTLDQAYEGTHSLKYTDDSSDAPQAYIWWITGLTDGQTIDASFWVYDDTDQASYPKGRIWGHYTSDPDDINSYAGSAGGNDNYSTIGWSQLSHSWVFDSDGGTRDGFVVEARCYGDDTQNVIYVDDAEITVGSSTAIIHHPTPPTEDIVIEVTVDSWYSEASWNVWDYAAGSWYFGTNQTFTAAYETVIDTLPLPLGDHAVYCWDSYGDGGIGGSIWNGDILLNEWASTDYTSTGIYDFSVFIPTFGDLAGYVMDTVTRAPIMDALVTCGTYWAFSGADGYYEIDDILVSSIAGPYTVTCEADGFNPATETGIIIETDLTTDLDFDLTAPTMDIDNTPISVLMLPNTTNDDNSITIENNGDGPLDWNATVPIPDRLEIEIPAYTGTPPVNTYRTSVELDDGGNSGSTSWHNQPLREILRGSTAWFRGGEYSTYFYGTFDTDTPGDMTEILAPPPWSSYAGDFDAVHTDFFYMNCNTDYNIYKIDCATGDATLVGPTGLTTYFNGMACDKVSNTMYACTGTNLYTVDLGTGAATLIGPMGTSLLVNLACDGSGNLYGVDISDDCLWSIDKNTGVGTLVGATGFAANYAQSMAWDPQTDVLFWAAYGGGLNGNLRVIDRTTGSSAFVGDFEGGREVTVFAFPGGVDSWLTLDPTSGTIPAGGSEDVQVTFDSNGILPGESLFGDIEFYSDPNVGTVTVPAEMTVYIPEGYVFEGFDDPDFPPFGWQNVDSWNRFTNDPYSGDGYAHTSWYHKYDAILHTPRLILGDEDFISFYWINANLYDTKGEKIEGGDTLYVEISNTYNNIVPVWETLIALSSEEEMTEYENVLVSIPAAYAGHSAKIRFRHRSLLNGISRGIGLDNIIMPPPYLPVNFSVDPEYQSDYDEQEVTVDYDVEITNDGIQADRYNISVLNSRTTKDVLLAEGFESAVPPVGWTQEYVSGTINWIQATEGQYSNPPAAYEGTYLALFYNGSYDGFTTKLVTPEIAFSDSKDGELTFWHAQVNWVGDQDELNVYYKNSPTGTWTLLESYTTDVSTWTQRTISLPNTSSTYYIAFEGIANYGYGVCIDDVQVTGTSGPGPGPGPTGWPATVSVPYLDLEPGESGSFVVSVAIPEDAVLDDVNTSTVYIASREDTNVNETAVVQTTCHPKDPYEPNDLMVDATPADFDFVSDGAQIYYNPDYRDKDLDIYTIDCLEGEIVWCAFELPEDETQFDGAIKLVDADSTELAWADSWAGGGSEYL
ncbi:MAG: carboxypeptidase regulatory-like domain-containing protein, partial [Candidatus Cloacimonetes bacterium]|nr:carboxypeptidase regulatory-like domain-containing protein [Candidatus Cloacimonadota bacterium]